jgi:hypothetical protein
MKTQPWLSHLNSPSGLLLAVCLATATAAAQDKPGPAQTPPTTQEPATGTRYALEIASGNMAIKGQQVPATLARIADVLRDLYPEVNIVLAPEVGKVQVLDLKLRAPDLPEALEALRVASGDAFVWRQGMTAGGGGALIDPATGVAVPPAPSESKLYVLSRNEARPEAPRPVVEVFNLSGYLEHLGKRNEKEIVASLDEIKMIVSDTLDRVMQGRATVEDMPRFQFHPGANLFIVIGPPEAIEVAQKVVSALPGVAGARGYPPNQAAARTESDPKQEELMRTFRRRYGLDTPGSQNPAPPPASTARPPGAAR